MAVAAFVSIATSSAHSVGEQILFCFPARPIAGFFLRHKKSTQTGDCTAPNADALLSVTQECAKTLNRPSLVVFLMLAISRG